MFLFSKQKQISELEKFIKDLELSIEFFEAAINNPVLYSEKKINQFKKQLIISKEWLINYQNQLKSLKNGK